MDISYHRSCYITHVLRKKSDSHQEDQNNLLINEGLIATNCEFFSMLKSAISETKIKIVNDIHDAYCCLLEEHGVSNFRITKDNLKRKIEASLDDVLFSRPSNRKSDLLCSQAT